MDTNTTKGHERIQHTRRVQWSSGDKACVLKSHRILASELYTHDQGLELMPHSAIIILYRTHKASLGPQIKARVEN